jgi:hypothetical protein
VPRNVPNTSTVAQALKVGAAHIDPNDGTSIIATLLANGGDRCAIYLPGDFRILNVPYTQFHLDMSAIKL